MIETAEKQLWKSQRQGFLDSLVYLKGRREGIIKSLRTPWPKVNDAGCDGFEWGSLIVIGARPGTGKTLIKDQIVRESFKINHGENFRVLEFNLEIPSRVAAIREYSNHLERSYKYLCSADGTLSDEDLQRCYEYAKLRVKYPIDVVEEPCTVSKFKETIEEYMRVHSTKEGDKTVYTNLVVTLDHSILLKQEVFEKNKMDMLYSLGEATTELKRKYPIVFIVLSQLNRDVNKAERLEDGKQGNYISDSDIFGADALLQHADIVVGVNRPGMKKIRFYGPDRYIIDNDRIVVMHFLKCRNGDLRTSFFQAEFEKMMLIEGPTPPMAIRK